MYQNRKILKHKGPKVTFSQKEHTLPQKLFAFVLRRHSSLHLAAS